MPAPYNTLGQNSTRNLYEVTKFVNNEVTNGLMMPLILGATWLVLFIGALVEGRQASRAFIFASFVGSILSIPLALIGLISNQYMYFLFLMVGIGVIWYKLDNAPGL